MVRLRSVLALHCRRALTRRLRRVLRARLYWQVRHGASINQRDADGELPLAGYQDSAERERLAQLAAQAAANSQVAH